MASIASYKKHMPNVELLEDSIYRDVTALPFTATPQSGWTGSNIVSTGLGTLSVGAVGKRLVFEFPDQFKGDDVYYKPIAWLDSPIPTGGILITPQSILSFTAGWDQPSVSGVDTGNTINFLENKRYIFDFTVDDINTLTVTIWDECGGGPLGTMSYVETDLMSSPRAVSFGWPPDRVLAAVAGYAPYAIDAYMVKVLNCDDSNAGPTDWNFESTQVKSIFIPATTKAGDFIDNVVVTHNLCDEGFAYSFTGGDSDKLGFRGRALVALVDLNTPGPLTGNINVWDKFGLGPMMAGTTVTVV